MKTVSIITLTKGREKQLLKCINSVYEQTYFGSIEHVIIHDSSQFVAQEADRLIEIGKNVKLIAADTIPKSKDVIPFYIPSRLAFMRNYAVTLCDGEYICYLDDDNWIATNHIESLVYTLESETGIDVAYCWRWLVREDGTPWVEEEYPWTPVPRLATSKNKLSRYIYEELVRYGVRVPGSNLARDTVIGYDGQPLFTVDTGEFLISKTVQEKIPFTVKYPWRKMTGDYSEDHDFIERAYLVGSRFKCTEKATLFYTIGGYSQPMETGNI